METNPRRYWHNDLHANNVMFSVEDFSFGSIDFNKCMSCDEMRYIRSNGMCQHCCDELDIMMVRTIAVLEIKIFERMEPEPDASSTD